MQVKEKRLCQRERIELHCHTKSGGNATMYPGELIRYASKMSMPAIAITDTGNIFAFPEIESVCSRGEYITRPIYGMEVLVRYPDGEVYTLTALVKNETGKENLYELISTVECGDMRPVFDYDSFTKYRDGLLIGSGAEKGKLRAEAVNNSSDDVLNGIIDELDYIELLPYECDEEINKRLIQLAEKKGKIAVAVSDAHFLTENDRIPWKVVNKMLADSFNKRSVHLLSTGEMMDAFSYLPDDKATEIVIDNTYKIVDQCEKIIICPKHIDMPEVQNAGERLRDICYKALDHYYEADDKDKAREWLNKEIGALDDQNECGFLLEIKELRDKAGFRSCDLSLRGRYAGSIVLYLLGITGVDPIRFNLPPETLYGKDLSGTFNLDMNVPASLHDSVVNQIGTLEGVGRAFTDTYQESFYADYAEHLMNYSGLEEIVDYSDDEIKKICEKIVGNAIKWKKWPTTIWMLPEGMDYKKYLPVCKTADGSEVAYFSHYNWSPVRTVNVYRHDTLEALRQLSLVTGVDLSDVPTDFETVKELFVADDTGEVSSCKDIPGFKTGLVRSMVAKLRPETLEDIAKIIGMAHGTNVWSDNQEKLVEEYGLGAKDIICNREDIYDYLLSKGFESGEAYDISECIRKGIPKSKKTSWLKWKKDMFNADVPTWYIEACEKIRYLLPRAHSVSYSLMYTRMAWFKLNYPKEYRMVVEELGL